jgi:hypothetical protein
LGGCRVFASVSLARHFQDSADFSQPVVGSFQAEFDPVLLAEPGSHFLGPLEAPRAELLDEFRLRRRTHSRLATPLLKGRPQHRFDSPSPKKLRPRSYRRPAHSRLRSYLFHRRLAQHSKPDRLQSLPISPFPVFPQRLFDLLQIVRPDQYIFSRHPFFYSLSLYKSSYLLRIVL